MLNISETVIKDRQIIEKQKEMEQVTRSRHKKNGAEHSGKASTRTLFIAAVPAAVLDGVQHVAEAMRPPVRRNALILHVLSELAAGRLSIGANHESVTDRAA